MLGIFDTYRAITESASGGTFSKIRAHEFMGNIDEASAEFSYLLLTESYDLNEYLFQADEIISESIIKGNYDKVNIIIENVLNDAFNKVKQLWDKLYKWAKGLFEKAKVFALQFVGMTDKWANAMESRIKAAKPSNFTAEFHKWNSEVLGRLCDSKLIDKSNSTVKDCVDRLKSDIEKFKSGASYTLDDEDRSSAASAEDVIRDYEALLGISVDRYDKRTFMSELDKKVTGGEKLSQSVNSTQANEFFNVVKGSKKQSDEVKKMYGKLVEAIDSERKTLNSIKESYTDAATNSVSEDADENTKAKVKADITKLLDWVSNICSNERNFVNSLSSAATKYLRMQAKEYMQVLTAYANAGEKEAKKKY